MSTPEQDDNYEVIEFDEELNFDEDFDWDAEFDEFEPELALAEDEDED